MKLKNKFTTLLLAVSPVFFAQELTTNDSISPADTNISYLDSIKKTFVRDEMAERVDSMWMNELSVLNQYDDLSSDVANIDIISAINASYETKLASALTNSFFTLVFFRFI